MSSGTWSVETVAGHSVEIYTPACRRSDGGVAIYLHGVHLNRLDDKPAFTREFDLHGLVVVCPRTERSWWTDRICLEFDPRISAERYVVDHVLPFVGARFDTRPPHVALLGTSMGGQGALRISYKYPQLFPTVVAISPAIDFHKRYYEGDETIPLMYDDPEAARQETAILYVHPLNWPLHQFFCCDPEDHKWWDSSDRLRMKLYSLGVPHECDLETSGGGHSFDYYGRMAAKAIGFLSERLGQPVKRF